MLKIIAVLIALEHIEPAEVAKALGVKPGPTTDVTPYRHETRLELPGVKAATVVVGGEDKRWRIVEIVADPKSPLKLTELPPEVLRLPHTMEPRSPHAPPGTSHHFRTKKLELAVDVDADDRVERVILTTDVKVPENAPPLRTK
jgi:hypothetical protein